MNSQSDMLFSNCPFCHFAFGVQEEKSNAIRTPRYFCVILWNRWYDWFFWL